MISGGIALRRYASLDSTNSEARRLAEAGTEGPLWIVADEQTAGRGRRGRAWVSQSGNLFATLLLTDPPPLARSGQLSFAAALAVCDTIGAFAPVSQLALKWPNDVLLDGEKVAGILLEASGQQHVPWLAIGMGINLARAPKETAFPATSIAAVTGHAPARDTAVNRLVEHWDRWFARWTAEGFPTVRDAWLARAARLGDKIAARSGEMEIVGVFESLDSDGALLLREPSGALSRISAGEVFFA